MRNVFSTLLITAHVMLCFGCKTPSVEVGSLGKKIPAPLITFSNLSDGSDFHSDGFIHFSGLCHRTIQDIHFSIDNIRWNRPLANPNFLDTSLENQARSNDISCDDGHFDFYITRNDLISLQIPTEDITFIYLLGSSPYGDTDILILTVPEKPHSPGSERLILRALRNELKGEECLPIKVSYAKNGDPRPAPDNIEFLFADSSQKLEIYEDSTCSGLSIQGGVLLKNEFEKPYYITHHALENNHANLRAEPRSQQTQADGDLLSLIPATLKVDITVLERSGCIRLNLTLEDSVSGNLLNKHTANLALKAYAKNSSSDYDSIPVYSGHSCTEPVNANSPIFPGTTAFSVILPTGGLGLHIEPSVFAGPYSIQNTFKFDF